VTPSRIVEALDEFEDGDARFGLGLEATPIEISGAEDSRAAAGTLATAHATAAGVRFGTQRPC
jgi:hypothetical protein